MPYVPSFATPYLEACVAQGMDPRSSLETWIQQQSQSSNINEPLTTITTTHAAPSDDRPLFLSSPTSSSATHQQHDFSLPSNSTPTKLSPSRFSNFKTNIGLAFPKRLGPFITQTSPIFQEVIGGIAAGEAEHEEEQGDRRVFGFIFTPQGKRRTVFIDPGPVLPRPDSWESPLPLPLPLPRPAHLSPSPPRARTSRPISKRKPKSMPTTVEDSCKTCAAYTQFHLIEELTAVMPAMPRRCLSCEFKESIARTDQSLAQWQKRTSTSISTSASASAPTPQSSPPVGLTVDKRPMKAAAGNDQMILQMMADVERNPKRARRTPAKFRDL